MKHTKFFAAILFAWLLAPLAYATIDMQAHVASDEGKTAYTTYQAKQSAYYTGSYSYATMMSQTGNTLFGTINTLMGNTCNNGSGFSYDKLKNNYINVDRDLNNSSNIIGYYDGSSFSGTWDSGKTWNREHTWPQSKFKGSNSSGTGIPIGYDMQSVRPASTAVNSSRGNTAYGESSDYYDPNEIAINNSAYNSSNNGSYRGDCARVILYDYVVYGKWGSYSNSLYKSSVTADLLTQIGTNSNSVFESLAILLKWHMEDPPSLTEMVRNDGGQDYQGNRNPFIDYPELAINMLKDQTGVTAYTVTYNTTETASPAYAYTTPYGFVTYLTSSAGTHPTSVTVSGATSTYDASIGRLTLTNVTGNVTITSNTSSVKYQIRWSVEGSITSAQVSEGARPTAPSVADCSSSRVFMGWTTSSSVNGSKPSILYSASEIPYATAAATYYAVFADKQTSSSGNVETTVSMSSFSTTEGNVDGDTNVSYAAAKGNAGTAPVVNSNQIRIYQNGGLLTITANNSKTLKSITIGSAMATTVTYAIDGGSASADQSISKNGTYTLNNISASSVVFTCTGTTSSTRLYLNSLSVTYSGEGSSTTYSNYSLSCSTTPITYVTVTFHKNDGTSTTTTQNVPKSTSTALTANPWTRTHYTFNGWNTKANGSGTSYSDGQSVTISAALDLYAQWTEDDQATVIFMNNGVEFYSQTDYIGEDILISGAPSLTDCDDYTFEGWSESEYAVNNTDAAVLVTPTVIPNVATTYYAVYSKTESGGTSTLTNNYKKITSTAELTNGNYLIVANNSGAYNAMSTTWKSTYYLAGTDVTPSGDVITTTTANIIWQINVSGNQATIYNATSQYLYIEKSGSYYNIKLGDNTTDNKFTYSVSDGAWVLTSATYTDRQLEYYTTQTRWAYYTSQDAPIYLYKQQTESGSITYHTTAPDCNCEVTITITSADETMGYVEFVE